MQYSINIESNIEYSNCAHYILLKENDSQLTQNILSISWDNFNKEKSKCTRSMFIRSLIDSLFWQLVYLAVHKAMIGLKWGLLESELDRCNCVVFTFVIYKINIRSLLKVEVFLDHVVNGSTDSCDC